MDMNRLCYITRNYYNLTGAGNKAKTDNEDTLSDMGAVNIGLPRTVYNNKVLAFFLDLAGVLRACCSLKKGDVLVLQYPIKKYFTFLCRVARLKGAQTVSIIHDLGSFRRRKLTTDKEIERLSHADYIIASNEKMKVWLETHGMKKPVGALGLFDYRSASVPKEKECVASTERKVVYAGALSMRKNTFLILLSQHLSTWSLLVCGNKDGLQGLQDNTHIEYRGFMPSEAFIKSMNADFGLVWDGDSLDTCSGDWGEYLRWNSPHKASFYLRAGLPLIVWKESAIAPIITREGVGIAISSLEELSTRLTHITAQELATMKHQAALMAERLNKGEFLKEALSEARKSLTNSIHQ